MQLSDFDFHLPNERIAQYPLATRSHSRLLHLPQSGPWSHHHFYDLPSLLRPGDLLVMNDSKVIPARLYGRKETGGAVELLVERVLEKGQFTAHVKASKAPKCGTTLVLGDARCRVLNKQDTLFTLAFEGDGDILDVLYALGEVPLPPYMQRQANIDDTARYQTVYAEHAGSVAAPTAGLHFDDEVFAGLKERDIDTAFVTLHVGAGTFQPVRAADIREHVMHQEVIDVSQALCDKVNATKARGGRVIAVGTTSVRCLETATTDAGMIPYRGETGIFIYPGYQFKTVDGLITNFHLPQSSLLMLVSAFSGRQRILAAYHEAIEQQYRFYSYGDAMLLL